MTVVHIGKINLIHDINYLTQQHAVLHILVQIRKDFFNNPMGTRSRRHQGQFLERGEQVIIDEIEQFVAGKGMSVFVVGCPVAPAARFGNDGMESAVGFELPFIFLRVIDFEEEEPCHLFDTLRVTGDTGILTHHILQSFNEIIYCHRLCCV